MLRWLEPTADSLPGRLWAQGVHAASVQGRPARSRAAHGWPGLLVAIFNDVWRMVRSIGDVLLCNSVRSCLPRWKPALCPPAVNLIAWLIGVCHCRRPSSSCSFRAHVSSHSSSSGRRSTHSSRSCRCIWSTAPPPFPGPRRSPSPARPSRRARFLHHRRRNFAGCHCRTYGLQYCVPLSSSTRRAGTDLGGP